MKCNICNTEVASFKDIQLNKLFYSCPNCEIIFLDEKFYVTQTDEKYQYDQHQNSLDNKGYVEMFNDFLDFTIQNLQINYVLDFGSGPTPVLAELLKRRGLSVDYYDKFYQPIKIYENKKYDLITSTEVFEHLKNPLEILNLLSSHLNQRGIISLMTLFHSNNQKDFLKWWYRRDPTHITFFTPKSFEVLASKCGLKVISCDNKRVVILQKM